MKTPCRLTPNRLLDGKISWKTVILSAVICGIVTGVILDLESVLFYTSFFNIGVCFEFWIFAAVIIFSKCQKPIEAACKVFVFFLISQPLIYLIQVPFQSMGWGIFQRYTGWFIWTLLTFPGAYIGWHTKKRSWLSAVIFMVAIFILSIEFGNHIKTLLHRPPYQLLALLFILAQIALYIFSFKDTSKRCVLGGFSVISMAVSCFLYLR